MKQVKKVIIPAAGWGTRFIPLTKVVEKELVPVLNRPIIDYLVKEAINSGIEEVILVLSKRKEIIKQYFEENQPLQKILKQNKKTHLYDQLVSTNRPCKITVVYQRQQLGLGHAIYTAHNKIKSNEPFAIILGDDLMDSKVPALKQLIDAYNKKQSSILGVMEVENHDIHKYGIVAPKGKITTKLFEIKGAIEKPEVDKAPSNLAIAGRYIFDGKIMEILGKKKVVNGVEIDLIDAFDELLTDQKMYAIKMDGNRYDLGSKEGFVKATVDYALKDPEIKDAISKYLKNKK